MSQKPDGKLSRTPIFIGGVGRSGTTVLMNALYKHPEVWGRGSEIRWFCDPDGVASLYSNLIHNWSPFTADLAIKRFKATLLDSLDGVFVQIFGFFCARHLDRMIEKITRGESMCRYYGWRDMPTYETDPIWLKSRLPSALRELLDDLMHSIDREERFFIDDTPENVTAFDTFTEIWPDSLCIHSVRHPLDIIAAIKGRQSRRDFSQIWWWPQDPRTIAQRIRHVWDHYEATKPKGAVVVRLEDLVRKPDSILSEICERLGIEYHPDIMSDHITEEKAHFGRYKDGLTDSEIRECLLTVAPILKAYGYEA